MSVSLFMGSPSYFDVEVELIIGGTKVLNSRGF